MYNTFVLVVVFMVTLFTVIITSFIIVFGWKLLEQGYAIPRAFCIFYAFCIMGMYLFWVCNVTLRTKPENKDGTKQ